MPFDAAGIGGGPFLMGDIATRTTLPKLCLSIQNSSDGVSFSAKKACLPVEDG